MYKTFSTFQSLVRRAAAVFLCAACIFSFPAAVRASVTPAPVAASKVTPAPVAASKVTPAPVAASKTTPAPVAASKTTPAPVAASKTTPAPVAAPKVTPAPSVTPAPTPAPAVWPGSVIPLNSVTPEDKLLSAVRSLNKTYELIIRDPNYDITKLEKMIESEQLKEWSYRGTRTKTQITLTWEFTWDDGYAVLAAYYNAGLADKLTPAQRRLLDVCRKITAGCVKEGMTDYEKVLAIHDYIVLNCTYDIQTAGTRDTRSNDPYSAYGALINGLAVCQGYTEAASLLFWMAGIENHRPESDDHIWNLIKLDDGYYHLDVTWNDPIGGSPDAVQYDFFNLTDAQISRYPQHDWHNRKDLPAATAETYHYFRYNGLYASSYKEVKQLITDAFKAGEKEVAVWVGDARTRAYDWKQDLQFIYSLRVNGRGVKSISYIPPGASRDTLTVLFNFK